MVTDKIRVASYISKDTFQALEKYCFEHGCIQKDKKAGGGDKPNLSAATEEILKHYFNEPAKPIEEVIKGAIAAEFENFNDLSDQLKKAQVEIDYLRKLNANLQAQSTGKYKVTETIEAEVKKPLELSQAQLARRLGTNHSSISRRCKRNDFAFWSKSVDPEEFSWRLKNQKGRKVFINC